jgi:hypothetical protein
MDFGPELAGFYAPFLSTLFDFDSYQADALEDLLRCGRSPQEAIPLILLLGRISDASA